MAARFGATVEEFEWPTPDPDVLRLRRKPPLFPISVLGREWGDWVRETGKAAAAPVDYVVAPLLAGTSTLIGNARWPQAWPGWCEPPHLWDGAVGESGDGKSPGADPVTRDVLPIIEQRMRGDFDNRFFEWSVAHDIAKAETDVWHAKVREAKKNSQPIPDRPPLFDQDEPYPPTLRFNDMTVENVCLVLATVAPKGILIVRDEMVGWVTGMSVYNASGRPFWVEAYGGRPYRTGRNKNKKPVDVPRLVVAFYGGVQPDKISELMKGPDDGLLSRILWFWPDPVEFDVSAVTPNGPWAIEAFDRLRMLEMTAAPVPEPIRVPLNSKARELMVKFARDMQKAKKNAGGLLKSAYGKARGLALRLSLVLEFLWWCGRDGADAPPTTISVDAFTTATKLLTEYFLPMAELVFGDAAVLPVERNTATLARWIIKSGAKEVHLRTMQRKVRLPDLRVAEDIRAACEALVDADWLVPPPPGSNQGRARVAYKVNPRVHEIGMPDDRDTAPTDAAGPADTAEQPMPVAAEPQDEAPSPSAKPKTVLKRPVPKPKIDLERDAPAATSKIILKRPGADPPLEQSEDAPIEVEGVEAERAAAVPNGDTNAPTAKPLLSALEQAIVEYDQAFPGLSIATIAKSFGQPKADVAALLGREE
jgi:hypothetical protein